MIKLKNIVRKNNIVTCDIFPEDSKNPGTIVYDINKSDIQEYRLPKGYEWCKNHIAHASRAIKEMIKAEDTQSEKTVSWY